MPTIPLVTSSTEASSNPAIDYLIVAIIAGVVIGILWLFLKSKKKQI
jgi:formate/nitrite transporter FocA (FNT family)